MSYQAPIRYFLILLSMLLLSGFWMFASHTGLTIDGVNVYYAKKSFYGLLETVSPHLFGMGVVFFIMTHFFTVIKNVSIPKGIIVLFALILLSNVSGFFISYLALVKLLSTLLLIILSFVLIWKLQKVLD